MVANLDMHFVILALILPTVRLANGALVVAPTQPPPPPAAVVVVAVTPENKHPVLSAFSGCPCADAEALFSRSPSFSTTNLLRRPANYSSPGKEFFSRCLRASCARDAPVLSTVN